MQINDEFYAVIYSNNYPQAFGSCPIKLSDQMCFWQDFSGTRNCTGRNIKKSQSSSFEASFLGILDNFDSFISYD